MSLPIILVLTPIAIGIVVLFTKKHIVRWIVVSAAALAQAALAVAFAVTSFGSLPFRLNIELPFQDLGIAAVEFAIAAYFAVQAVKKRRFLPVFMAIGTVGLSLFGEHWTGGAVVSSTIFADQLSLIMVLIIGVVGGLILFYATGYLKSYHADHPAVKDRRPVFGSVMLIFLGAMHGLVICNDMRLMLMFWEITTWASYILIGYAQNEESDRSAFRALNLNMAGGLCFSGGIILFAAKSGQVGMDSLVSTALSGGAAPIVAASIALIAIAALIKSAQLPFTSWLLGAMVAPTPVSALLHSSTMVKAGCFVLIRLAPALSGTTIGYLVAFIGILTFIAGAFAAVSARNAKRVLALSTVSNLGLITTCAGLGTYQLAWVAFFLVIFHAVAKALLFLCVGTTSEAIGSLDVEDMGGLIQRMPRVCLLLIIGIFAMFVAPFGMLVSKWAAMEAFITMHSLISPIMIVLLAYGSATTVFFWTKWLGIVIRSTDPNAIRGIEEKNVTGQEFFSGTLLAIFTIAVCLGVPALSRYAVEPYLLAAYGKAFGMARDNAFITVVMAAMIIVVPGIFILISNARKGKLSPMYMSARPSLPDGSFAGSAGTHKKLELRSYYLVKYFSEGKILGAGFWFACLLVLTMLGVAFL
jgi:ech hydrogenase subunit A